MADNSFEPQYWCVWREGGGSPTVKHATFQIAKAEAQRLARQNPGMRFAVLAAAAAYVKDDVREVRFQTVPWGSPLDPDDAAIPF